MTMRIDRSDEDGVAVVDVDGDLDLTGVEEVDAALAAALSAGGPVVVDLEDVAFIDSTGMRAIIDARRRSRDESVPMVLVCPEHAAVWRLLELTGTTGFFAVEATRAAAVAAARG